MKNLAIKLLLSTISIFAPIKAIMATALILILCDFVSGMLVARKTKKPISSAEMRRTISKILIYQIVLMMGFLLETYLLQGLLPAVKLIGSVIGLTEMKSILENMEIILGKPVFQSLIVKFGSKNDPLVKELPESVQDAINNEVDKINGQPPTLPTA